MLEWDIMPTDWSTLETDLVRKIKTKFYGNPRYVEIIGNSNKKSQETTEHPIAQNVELKFDEEGGEEDITNINSLTYNDIVSVTVETDEIMETVWTRVTLC